MIGKRFISLPFGLIEIYSSVRRQKQALINFMTNESLLVFNLVGVQRYSQLLAIALTSIFGNRRVWHSILPWTVHFARNCQFRQASRPLARSLARAVICVDARCPGFTVLGQLDAQRIYHLSMATPGSLSGEVTLPNAEEKTCRLGPVAAGRVLHSRHRSSPSSTAHALSSHRRCNTTSQLLTHVKP